MKPIAKTGYLHDKLLQYHAIMIYVPVTRVNY